MPPERLDSAVRVRHDDSDPSLLGLTVAAFIASGFLLASSAGRERGVGSLQRQGRCKQRQS